VRLAKALLRLDLLAALCHRLSVLEDLFAKAEQRSGSLVAIGQEER
jgi:hypothetical protein